MSERELECLRRKKWAKKRNMRVKKRNNSPDAKVVLSFFESKLAKAMMLNFK